MERDRLCDQLAVCCHGGAPSSVLLQGSEGDHARRGDRLTAQGELGLLGPDAAVGGTVLRSQHIQVRLCVIKEGTGEVCDRFCGFVLTRDCCLMLTYSDTLICYTTQESHLFKGLRLWKP